MPPIFERKGDKSTCSENEKSDSESFYNTICCSCRLSKTTMRICVLASLVITAIFFGLASYFEYSGMEQSLAVSDFHEVCKNMEFVVGQSVDREIYILDALQALVDFSCPTVSSWPNCSIPFKTFDAFSMSMSNMGQLRVVGYALIVKPSQLYGFEDFAYSFYRSSPYPTLGLSNFSGHGPPQKGVWRLDAQGHRVRVTSSLPNTTYNIITPVFIGGPLRFGNVRAAMRDLYSDPVRRAPIDTIINCTVTKQPFTDDRCVASTDFIQIAQDAQLRPGALMFSSTTVNSTLVGIGFLALNWDTLLSNGIPNMSADIVAVLSRGDTSFSLNLRQGSATIMGIGDLHDSRYSKITNEFTISQLQGPSFTVTLYMTRSWQERYSTYGPILSSVASVFVICFTAVLVIMYDRLMTKDLVEKEQVLVLKRDFVRYISHEIRTPMNTVHLGLSVLKDEMSSSISVSPHDSSETAELRGWVDLIVDIEDSTAIAINILSDLINYDKVTLGQLKLEMSLFMVIPLLLQAVKPFMVHGRLSDIDVTVDMDKCMNPKKLFIFGDNVKLQQGMSNLVSNASKFTPRGGLIAIQGTTT